MKNVQQIFEQIRRGKTQDQIFDFFFSFKKKKKIYMTEELWLNINSFFMTKEEDGQEWK